jgi:hypothetical protein
MFAPLQTVDFARHGGVQTPQPTGGIKSLIW